MNNNLDKITDRLLKIYSPGISQSSILNRQGLENIDWIKEEKRQKRLLNIAKTTTFITLSCFFVLVVIFIISLLKNERSEISLPVSIAIFCGYFTTSFIYLKASEKYTAFQLLKDLFEK